MTHLRRKVGLVLGSGGARGLAHIGIIKVLEKNNIPIDYLVGSSIGAFIGAAYASTKDIKMIESIFMATDWRRILKFSSDFAPFSGGLIKGEHIKNFAKNNLNISNSFDNLKIPFIAIATDIKTGQAEILKSGNLIESIRASVSLPGIFKPVKIKNKILIDGGLSNPVPTDIAKQMGADIIIAVDLDAKSYPQEAKKNGSNIMNNLINSVHIMQKNLSAYSSRSADIIIQPKINDILWIQFHKTSPLINAGKIATKQQLIDIKKIIN